MPALTGRVVDNANVLSKEAEQRVTGQLEALERATTDQLVVVTMPDLQGKPIEKWGLALGKGWGVGQKDVDNGVLLIVAPTDRKVRIEVGYGLEGLLTNQRAKQIIDTALLPQFRQGNIERGVEQGVNEIIGTLRSVSARPVPKLAKAA